MKRLLLTIFLMTAAVLARSQDLSIAQDTITWEVDLLTDLAKNQSETFHCKFVTHASGIRWLQRNDEMVSDMTVNAATGAWANLLAIGSYEFDVTYQGRAGRLLFERNGDTVTIRMTFMDGATNIMPYLFHVEHYSKN